MKGKNTMTDKVQLIKEEIERRISQFEAKYPKDLGGYWNDEESAAYDCAEEYKQFLLFIDSLLEEHNEDLEEEIKCYIKNEFPDDIGFPNVHKIAHRFAEWQKQQMMKDAVEATILDVDAQTIEFGLWPEKLLDIKEGDRVKIIIIKED